MRSIGTIEPIVERKLRSIAPGSSLHRSLVEVVRRQYKVACQERDRADKDAILRAQQGKQEVASALRRSRRQGCSPHGRRRGGPSEDMSLIAAGIKACPEWHCQPARMFIKMYTVAICVYSDPRLGDGNGGAHGEHPDRWS